MMTTKRTQQGATRWTPGFGVMTLLLPAVLALLSPGCKEKLVDDGLSGDVTVTDTTADVTTDAATDAADGSADAGDLDAADSASPDSLNPDTPNTDTPNTDTSACPGGVGCPCADNATCDNSTCLDSPEGKRCAQPCVDSCQSGYSCEKLGTTDANFFCVAKTLSLCAPCQKDADCQPQGGGAACVDYGQGGRFCGAVCGSDSDCPSDYACKSGPGAGGKISKQCRLKTGVCGCSPWAVSAGASTSCAVSNAVGSCAGSRKCTEKGLTACDAATAKVEVCNGVDDDCNGTKDDLPADASCVQTTYKTTGSGTPCSVDADCKDAAEGCDGGACRERIGSCPGTPICSASGALLCQGAKTPEEESCNLKDDDCDGKTDEGFVATLANGATATVGQACGAGLCAGGKVTCQNLSVAVCSTAFKAKAVDVCNGVDDDCDGLTDGGACEDGDACTTDVCDAVKLACSHAAAVDCDDGEVCTADSCVKGTGKCANSPKNGGCSDGDACTVGDGCKAGKCAAGQVKGCDDGEVCTVDSCDKKTGCVQLPMAGTCTDGDACTAVDACAGGTCKSGAAVKCDDGNGCTDDGCDQAKGCVQLPNAATCSDGDVCTVDDGCAGGGCKAGAGLTCDDGNGCTNDACVAKQGCVYLPNAASCSDGVTCTVGDKCVGSVCKAGPVSCDDGNGCTTDLCTVKQGCVGLPNAASCSDGDGCSVGDGCTAGVCKAGGLVDCDDGEVCTADSCVKGTGKCAHSLINGVCSDGDACSVGDGCTGGKCVGGGQKKVCDDGNGCTTDSCDSKTGCVYSSNASSCSDGDACTAKDTCSSGSCKSGVLKSCEDGKPCTKGSCTSSNGKCSYVVLSYTACCAAVGGKAGDVCVWTESVGRKWGLVPAGKFYMGCNATLDKSCSSNEKPQHLVTITKSYWLGTTEVTVAAYKACVSAGACSAPAGGGASANWGKAGRGQHPVNYVNWSQSQAYCKWAGGRLPTEAEWELAARGRCEENGGLAGCAAKMRTYPWGETSPVCGQHAVFNSGGYGCGKGGTWAVGTGSGSGLGPYGHADLSGNVWEWVSDYWDGGFYSKTGSMQNDPENTASSSSRVSRGGCFGNTTSFLRAGYRGIGAASGAYADFGLRCVRSFP